MYDLKKIEEIIFDLKEVDINPSDITRVQESYEFLSSFSKDKVIYGINTGFGPMAQYRIDDQDLTALQYNIIRSHSCGAGANLDPLYVRAAMLTRLETFLGGKSGVHPEVITLLKAFIDNEIYPEVPRHGSVGASGDLVQLAHIALALTGEGTVVDRTGQRIKGSEAMERYGITPLKIHIREGLALTNGTAVMTGIGIVNLVRAKKLLHWAIRASVMINEVAESYDDFMAIELNELKNHSGQNQIAREMREIAKGSTMMRSRRATLYDPTQNNQTHFEHKVQPYYSLRCVPQILGAVCSTIENVEKVLLEEFHSVDDNPIVDPQSQNIYHGGNFHGEYISQEMDKLKIAVTKMTILAERQMNYLYHDKINGILPPFLNLGILGLNYGLQAAQFTATSTTAESQTLSNPMSVHSLPSNNDNQDVVSMGTNSALLAGEVIENCRQVLSIHLISLAQAIDCIGEGAKERLCAPSRELYDQIREISPTIREDRSLSVEIREVMNFIYKPTR